MKYIILYFIQVLHIKNYCHTLYYDPFHVTLHGLHLKINTSILVDIG